MIDYPFIRLHEKVLQWAWDTTGVSRMWAIRASGALACAADIADQIRVNGRIGVMSVIMAIAVLSAQGASETRSHRQGKNSNLFIEVSREMPIKTVLRIFVMLMAIIGVSKNMVEPLLYEVEVRWFRLLSEFAIVSFFYFIDSKEPTEPPKYEQRQTRLAPGALR